MKKGMLEGFLGVCIVLLLITPISANFSCCSREKVNYIDASSCENNDNYESEGNYFCGGVLLPDTVPSDRMGNICSYPPSWDWRDAVYNSFHGDWTTPVKSQGSCGSCWDFAAMGALEAIIKIREGYPQLDIDLSEQYLLSCPPDSGGCRGWSAYYAYQYIKNNGGALPEDCFPYKADDTIPCSDKCSDWEDHLIPIENYGVYRNPGRDAIKSIVYNNGPVVASMTVYDDFGGYTGGVYEHPGSEPVSDINHQVVIVGYNDNQGCWICKNSWGKYWGENGFFRIAYGDCQIEHEIIYVDYDENAIDWPPIADAGGKYEGSVGTEIQFDGSNSIAVDNEIVSYEWDFGDGTTGEGMNPSHTYVKQGIYSVKLTVTDSKGKQDTDSTAVYIDVWKQDDCWVYDVELKTAVEQFFPFSLEGSISDLTFCVKNAASDDYQLNFKGRMNGQVNVLIDTGIAPFPLNITGWLRLTTLQGKVSLTKDGFGLKEINFHLHGKARVWPRPVPIILPVPFDIQATLKLDNPCELFGFDSFDIGSYWIIPSPTFSIDITFSPYFGIIISKSFEFTDLGFPSWATIYTEIVGKEEVTVPAGTYEAYKIWVEEGGGVEYYYAPEVSNIIKIQTNEDFPFGYFRSELKSTESITPR